ncbi:MAG TPA: hypothetical protein VF796_08470 [Humisphaera sp.]
MSALPAILALLTAAAGWYYLFYSKAAARLSEFESAGPNAKRARLRRVGGGVMILIGVGIYLGFAAADERTSPRWFVAVWLGVVGLMAVLVVLALLDLRLTHRLRREGLRRAGGAPPPARGPRRGLDELQARVEDRASDERPLPDDASNQGPSRDADPPP